MDDKIFDMLNFPRLIAEYNRENWDYYYAETPLACVTKISWLKAVMWFVEEQKQDVNEIGVNGNAPLHDVHREEIARYLCEHGADPNIRNKDVRTPLHRVGTMTGVAKVLIEFGGNPEIEDNYGDNAYKLSFGRFAERMKQMYDEKCSRTIKT